MTDKLYFGTSLKSTIPEKEGRIVKKEDGSIALMFAESQLKKRGWDDKLAVSFSIRRREPINRHDKAVMDIVDEITTETLLGIKKEPKFIDISGVEIADHFFKDSKGND